jgi:hypothetical protein
LKTNHSKQEPDYFIPMITGATLDFILHNSLVPSSTNDDTALSRKLICEKNSEMKRILNINFAFKNQNQGHTCKFDRFCILDIATQHGQLDLPPRLDPGNYRDSAVHSSYKIVDQKCFPGSHIQHRMLPGGLLKQKVIFIEFSTLNAAVHNATLQMNCRSTVTQ